MAIGEGGVHLVHGHGVHARHLVLLLPLHSSVAKPNLDLLFRHAQCVRDLYSPSPRQIPEHLYFFLLS